MSSFNSVVHRSRQSHMRASPPSRMPELPATSRPLCDILQLTTTSKWCGARCGCCRVYLSAMLRTSSNKLILRTRCDAT